MSDLQPPIAGPNPDIDLRAQGFDPSAYAEPRQDDVSEQGVGELMGKLTHDVGDLFSTQVKLAVEEMKEEARKAGKGAGMMGGGGVLANLTLTLLTFALAYGLGDAFDSLWLGFLVVAVLVGAAAAVLLMKGKETISEASPVPRQTAETIEEDKQWLRQQMS